MMLNFKKEIETFQELFKFLLQKDTDSFKEWFNQNWIGKDKQESCLRLFSFFKLFPSIQEYDMCSGNFNLGTIIKGCEKFPERKLKDTGDKADMVLTDFDEKTIVVFTSKNLNNYHIGDLDIDDIENIFNKKYGNKTLILGVCIPSSEELLKKIESSKETSERLKKSLSSAIIIDHNDIFLAFYRFKELYKNSVFPQNPKKPLTLYFHQDVLSSQICERFNFSDIILLSAIARSGKTYICGSLISKMKVNNIFIILLFPNETKDGFRDFFMSYDCFSEYSTIVLGGKDKKVIPKLGEKNIIICSKQFLQKTDNKRKIEDIGWLKKLNFDLTIIDEPHFGGSTILARSVYKTYAKDSKKLMMTSTPKKPIGIFKIGTENIFNWSMDDIQLCKNLNSNNQEKLIEKHGESIKSLIDIYGYKNIQETYKRYPMMILNLFQFKPDIKEEIKCEIDGTDYGWSIDSLFMLNKSGDFIREKDVADYLRYLFGYKEGKYIPDDKSVVAKMEKLSKELGSRDIRCIMCFLNPNNISQTCDALEKLFSKYKIAPDSEIKYMHGEIVKKSQSKFIQDLYCSMKNKGEKKRLIIFSGKMATTGITIPQCDAVFHLDNSRSFDSYFQKSFRAMTEDLNKKIIHVYDCNIQRQFEFIVNFASNLFPNEKNRLKKIQYVIEQKLIILNTTELEDGKIFDTSEKRSELLAKYVYEKYISDVNITKTMLGNLASKLKIPDSYKPKFSVRFAKNYKSESTTRQKSESVVSSKSVEEINLHFGGRDTDMPVGKVVSEIPESGDVGETKIISNDNSVIVAENKDVPDYDEIEHVSENSVPEDENNSDEINMLRDIFPHMTIYSILLTLDQDEFDFCSMCKIIANHDKLKTLIIGQLRLCWGEDIPDNILDIFTEMYIEISKDSDELDEEIANIKDRFRIVRYAYADFYDIILKYLVPNVIERRNNGEVSTPPKVVNEMLDTLPKKFWEKPRKVLDLCSGKGVFTIHIIDRFMKSISGENNEEKLKSILENIYVADINPFNIFILELIFGQGLKSYCGDCLEKIPFNKKFTLIVSNPPYSTDPSKQDTKPLYNLFVEKYIDNADYCLFITPSRWFSGGKGLDKFREFMLERKDIALIQHFDNCKDVFPNVEIKGGVSYFLKKPKECPCIFNGISIQLSKYDILVDPKYLNLVEKCSSFPKIAAIFMNRGHYKIETNDKRLSNRKEEDSIICYVSVLKSKDRMKYIKRNECKILDSKWKVITSRASGKGRSGFSFMEVVGPDTVYTNSYIAFEVGSEEEGRSLISYLKCKLPNILLASRKISQDINTDTIEWIPIVPFDRIWNDKSVLEYFGMNENEICI